MKVIAEANQGVLKILARFNKKAEKSRLMHFVVETPVEDGVLLYNLLTFEMILLTEEENRLRNDLEYLKNQWFVVPENTNEKELADLVKMFTDTKQDNLEAITGYTIFSTTDCNARCFYCFELGRSRIPMTDETAHKVAQYICDHAKGKSVNISWFGGEPLINQTAIDIICNDLIKNGVEFKSSAVSNGYLFDESTVEKAVNLWNIKRVQISLDGTEEVYNKIKAYVYKDTNPYYIVLDNIGRLLEAGVAVNIRLNMDLYNAEDLMKLVNELAERFAGQEKLSIYANHIFEGNIPMAEFRTSEEWEQRDVLMCKLEELIEQKGFAFKSGIAKKMKTNHCMADSGRAVTILPDGNIGVCEHFSEDEFIGHIDKDSFDESVIQRWKVRSAEIPECAECALYPQCIRLEKCANDRLCFTQRKNGKLRKVQRQMRNEYQRWIEKTEVDETEDLDFD
ncbi:MAG: 4Fe-4S cluster-binding domain-containing protein [Clostridia bacterium]|nr:4Fe-4S cluster-binding domain-containing protein [Clostridia bacterium]